MQSQSFPSSVRRLSALVALAFASGAPLLASAQSTPAPGSGSLDIWFKAPRSGATISGSLSGTTCYTAGSGVSRVQFYMDGTALNTDSTMSDGMQCQLDTTRFSNGTHSLTAVAYNSSGSTRKDVISVNVRNVVNTAPTVSLTAPASGSTVSGTVSYAANATDNAGVARVDFALDGNALASDTASPYGGSLDTTKLANGSHTLRATAYDAAGLSASSQIALNVQNTVAQPPTTSTPAPKSGSLDVWFKAPTSGKTVSGTLSGSNCYVAGSGVSKVQFLLDGTALNTDSTMSDGMQCQLDTTKFANGAHSLTAVAYNSSGSTRKDVISINVQNSGSTTPPTTANTPPTVSITAPAAGATISGNAVACAASASDDKGVASVKFSLGSTALTTDTASPYNCSIDTTKFANGTYNLTAVATDGSGATTTATRTVTVANSTTPPPTTSAISSSDILHFVSPDTAFSQQSGAGGQVIGTYPDINQIPESGVTYTRLANGETVRLGKQTDPTDSSRRALVFQLAPTDPSTSGSKRSEFSFADDIQMDKVYWIAYRVYVYDWGALPSTDQSLFGTQVHSSRSDLGLSPTFCPVTYDGRTFRISLQYSTSSSPTTSNTVSVKMPASNQPGIPIPFGRWADMVFKFRQSTSSSGFFQAWMDGTQIANYTGPMGYNTPGYIDYVKIGYYNWSSFSTPRKILMRSPVVVQDPTGSKYSAGDLRSYVQTH